MYVVQSGSAQGVMSSLGSYVSARTPPWLRELLSVKGCLLLPLQPDLSSSSQACG